MAECRRLRVHDLSRLQGFRVSGGEDVGFSVKRLWLRVRFSKTLRMKRTWCVFGLSVNKHSDFGIYRKRWRVEGVMFRM